jgi:hypothetical protein
MDVDKVMVDGSDWNNNSWLAFNKFFNGATPQLYIGKVGTVAWRRLSRSTS